MPKQASDVLMPRILVALAVAAASCTGNIDGAASPGRIGGDSRTAATGVAGPSSGAPARPGASDPGGPGPVGGGAADRPAAACQPGVLAVTAARRLTRREYDSTIAALLGDTSGPARGFAPEGGTTGFDNAADGATLSDAIVEQYVEAAKALAKTAVKNLAGLLACDVMARGEDACAKAFIGRFGRRAFRRSLLADEQTRYEGLYASNKTSHGFAVAVELVVRALLTAPQFLYKVELGAGAGPKPGLVKLAPHELATRLSYFFWGTTPDEELLAAAETGGLTTPQQIDAQAQRLFTHQNGGSLMRDFYSQWLDASRLPTVVRGTSYTPALAAALAQESDLYFDRMVRERGAPWTEVMQSPVSFLNAELATHYGVPGVTGTQFREVMRPADRQRGFLTQGAFLTLQALPNESSPIHRGKFLRTHLLCEPTLVPPENIDPVIPPADASKTARQQLENKTQTAQPCKACHDVINPPGFGFDKFDQLGRWRDADSRMRPIDTTGTLRATDVDGAFQGHQEVIERLARSEQAQSCVVTQWLRYATARLEKAEDCGRAKELLDAFKTSGGSVRALALKIAGSEAFLYKGVSQ